MIPGMRNFYHVELTLAKGGGISFAAHLRTSLTFPFPIFQHVFHFDLHSIVF